MICLPDHGVTTDSKVICGVSNVSKSLKVIEKLNKIAQVIYDKKGFNILALDVSTIGGMSDYVLLAEGNIDRHLKALSQMVQNQMSFLGEKPLHVEGERAADWIVLDYGDIIVHLLVPELRERYSLEALWKAGQIVDLTIEADQMTASG